MTDIRGFIVFGATGAGTVKNLIARSRGGFQAGTNNVLLACLGRQLLLGSDGDRALVRRGDLVQQVC